MSTSANVEPAVASEALATRLDEFGTAFAVISRLLLAPPSAQLLTTLHGIEVCSSWPLRHDEQTARGLALLEESALAGEDAEILDVDYHEVLRVPFACPYESVHLTTDHLLFGDPTEEVREAYAVFGLVALHLDTEPDDHLGLEFDFVAQLCALALDARADDDEALLAEILDAQRRFLNDHVLRWAPACLTAMFEHAQSRFYRGVALLALGLLGQAAEHWV